MNKVILVGRLTKDPEVRYTQGENTTAIARFTLAVDRRFKRPNDEKTADFISCVAFGKNGEFFEKYGRKGLKIGVEGRIQTDSYTNKNGDRVYTTEVVIEAQEFVESKAKSEGTPSDNQGGYQNGSSAGYQGGAYDEFVNMPDGIDDELPFA